MKKIFCIALTVVLVAGEIVLTNLPSVFAAAAVVDAGNAVCPVSGDKVSGKHFVEYQGKRYGLCCAHCEKEFKKDPEKFIAALGNAGGHPHDGHSH